MRDIDNNWTPWPAEQRNWIKRLIRKIYIQYVGDCYIPKPKNINLVTEKQKIHPRYGEITHIVLSGKGYEVNGTYLFIEKRA